MDDDFELTPEEYADLQRRMREWEEAHPDVPVSQFMHPYFAEILRESLRLTLKSPLFDMSGERDTVHDWSKSVQLRPHLEVK